VTEPGPSLGADRLFLIDKPAGPTSQQVVSRVKRELGVRKAGHAGTLDPMATGLLVVGTGRATRLLGYLLHQDKSYLATIRLGQATTTDDAEGELVGDFVDASHLSDQEIAAVMGTLTGNIEQIPSSHSAIKVDGRRAYALARAGEEVVLEPRSVTVSRFEVVRRADHDGWADLDVVVDCSAGTYIRALARDLGAALGVGGHLTSLRRTRVGALDVAGAADPGGIGPGDGLDLGTAAQLVAPRVDVGQTAARDAVVGRPLDVALPSDLAAVFCGAVLLGLYRPGEDGRARPVVVFARTIDIDQQNRKEN